MLDLLSSLFLGDDIDMLCVAPRHIDRSDFFRDFYATLERHPHIDGLHKVENAFVPVIKLKFDNVKVGACKNW